MKTWTAFGKRSGSGDEVPDLPDRAPWAADPDKRRIFVVAGPVIVFFAGLAVAAASDLPLAAYLVAYPVLAGGLVAAFLIWGRQAAEAHAHGRRMPQPSLKAALALGAAVLALPVAAVATSGESGSVTIVTALTIFAGVALALGLLYLPRPFSPLLLVVPVAVVTGAVAAASWALFSVMMTFLGGGEPTHVELIIAWIVGALLGYGQFGAMAGRASGNILSRRDWWAGGLYVVGGSLLAYVAAMNLIT